jgi:magnesium-transporting ATPase (P-type)
MYICLFLTNNGNISTLLENALRPKTILKKNLNSLNTFMIIMIITFIIISYVNEIEKKFFFKDSLKTAQFGN